MKSQFDPMDLGAPARPEQHRRASKQARQRLQSRRTAEHTTLANLRQRRASGYNYEAKWKLRF